MKLFRLIINCLSIKYARNFAQGKKKIPKNPTKSGQLLTKPNRHS